MDFQDLAERLRVALDSKNQAREKGLLLSRKAIQTCARAIRSIHREEWEAAEALKAEARRLVEEAEKVLRDHPEVYHGGFLQDAQKEYAEAAITYAVIRGLPLPGPDELGVPEVPYLGGMAEAMGEVRRRILDLLRRGKHAEGEALLGVMDEIYYLFTSLDYPDALTGGLRRSTDLLRSLVERTRGEFTISVIQRDLRDALQQKERLLRG